MIFFSGVTSGELFSSVGNANGSDLPGDDSVDRKDDNDDDEEEEKKKDDESESVQERWSTNSVSDRELTGEHTSSLIITIMIIMIIMIMIIVMLMRRR